MSTPGTRRTWRVQFYRRNLHDLPASDPAGTAAVVAHANTGSDVHGEVAVHGNKTGNPMVMEKTFIPLSSLNDEDMTQKDGWGFGGDGWSMKGHKAYLWPGMVCCLS